MKLWTIQTETAWDFLQQREYLRCRRSDADGDLLAAYDWMATQMRNRIGAPPSPEISVPIWAWFQFDGVHRRRPDLRTSGFLPRGEQGYRIAFTIADDLALLSDFELWHYVLNYGYLPTSESDSEDFDRRHGSPSISWRSPPRDQKLDRVIRKSWGRIFDIPWWDPYLTVPPDQKSIQATFWQLDASWITSVDRFIAR